MGAKLLLDGRYLLGEMLGTGGMADVYHALDTALNREVAVKLFRGQNDDSAVKRLETEAKLLAALSHPGLVRIYDVVTEAEQPYLVLQVVRGTTLRSRLDRGPLDGALVTRLGVRLANTLAYVHSRKIVHRDVKPSNVLLDEENTCFLADFGIARTIGATRVTGNGQCVGTAAYLAPEQVRGHETGPPGDIYSLGLMLLECLTGKPEYDGPDVEAALARLTRSPKMPAWMPSQWAETLTAMTAQDPTDRPTAKDAARRIAAAAKDAPIPAPGDRKRRRKRVSAQATAPLSMASPRLKPVRAVQTGLVMAAVLISGLAMMVMTRAPAARPPATVAPAPIAPPAVVIPGMTGATQVIHVTQVPVADQGGKRKVADQRPDND